MPAISDRRYLVQASWDDAPHLSEEAKKQLLENIAPHMRDARSKGIPTIGAGAVYPFDDKDIVCEPFQIPPDFKCAYGMDVGWNRTAVIWGAIDPNTDVLYLYTEHYRGHAEPAVHATAIKSRGDWIPGVMDPTGRNRSMTDGESLLTQYRALGLTVYPAKNAVEAGIFAVVSRISAGKLKVFRTCTNWFAEKNLYRRDENGKVVKEFDHLMDATRYLVLSGLQYARTRPMPLNYHEQRRVPAGGY